MQLWPDYCAEADSEAAEDAAPVAIDDETTEPMPRMVPDHSPASNAPQH